MKTLRVLEAACGVVAGALGLATVVYTLSIMPAYAGISTVCNAPGQCVSTDLPSKTIAENQGVASLIPAILIFSLPFAAILAGALWDALRDEWRARVLLWTATVLLTVGICLASLTIGLFFVPVWLLAVAASLLALATAGSRRIASA